MTQVPSPDNKYCQSCGLYKECKSPFMSPEHQSESVKVLFVGEAPGAEEDEAGSPFVGRSGQLLRKVIKSTAALDGVGLTDDLIGFTNVVRCRPPGNKTPNKAQIDSCKRFLAEDVKQLNPEYIVLLGNSALKAVTSYTKISEVVGTSIKTPQGRTIYPIYHPAFILRNASMVENWFGHFRNLYQLINPDSVKSADQDVEYILVDTFDKLHAMYEAWDQATTLAFDTETNTLDLYSNTAQVFMWSVSDGKHAWAVPLREDWPIYDENSTEPHYDKLWESEFIHACKESVKRFSSSATPKLGHNVKFDYIALRKVLGCDEVTNIVGDSQAIGYILDSRKTLTERALKPLAKHYLGMGAYDDKLQQWLDEHNTKDYSTVPLEIIWKYAAKDAIATYLLHDLFYKQLSEANKIVYHNILIPTLPTLAEMELNGLKIDRTVTDVYHDKYAEEVKALVRKIQADPLADKTLQAVNRKRKEQGKTAFKVFNPNSPILMPIMMRAKGVPLEEKTKSGLYARGKEILEPLEHDFSIVSDYLMYKRIDYQIRYTFNNIQDWISDDKLVHSNYSADITATGRLSSATPNMQNIPSKTTYPGTIMETYPVKNGFKSRFKNGLILQLDFSAMELRVGASVAFVYSLIDALTSGKDVHRYAASMVLKKPMDEITKIERQNAKALNFGLWYMGTEYTIKRKYGIPLEEGRVLVARYFNEFPEIKGYHQACIDQINAHSYIDSPFGRRRYFDKPKSDKHQAQIYREAANMPIQSAASDCLLMALNIMRIEYPRLRLNSVMNNTVHDSVFFDVFPGEEYAVIHFASYIMDNVSVLAKEYWPDVNFDWLKVPLKSEASIGRTWGTQKALECDASLASEAEINELIDRIVKGSPV